MLQCQELDRFHCFTSKYHRISMSHMCELFWLYFLLQKCFGVVVISFYGKIFDVKLLCPHRIIEWMLLLRELCERRVGSFCARIVIQLSRTGFFDRDDALWHDDEQYKFKFIDVSGKQVFLLTSCNWVFGVLWDDSLTLIYLHVAMFWFMRNAMIWNDFV
jgi:hypothetical protein